MALTQAPALDPTVTVPRQELPLRVLDGLADKYGDTIRNAFERIEERRFAAQVTCTITRPLTPADLADVEVIREEPEPRHDRRIVNDRGDIVSLEKGYFSGHPEPIKFTPGRHRGKLKEETVFEEEVRKTRRQRFMRWLERQLKKVGLAYDG